MSRGAGLPTTWLGRSPHNSCFWRERTLSIQRQPRRTAAILILTGSAFWKGPIPTLCTETVLTDQRISSAEDEAAQGQVSLVEPRTCGDQGAWKSDRHDYRFEDL